MKKTQANKRIFCVHGLINTCYQNVYTSESNLEIQCILYQNFNGIFHRIRTNNFKIYVEPQKTLNSQNNHEKKTELEESYSLISNCTEKATVIETVWEWHKTGIQFKSPKINPHTYKQLIYNKGGKNIQ